MTTIDVEAGNKNVSTSCCVGVHFVYANTGAVGRLVAQLTF